MMDFEKKMSIIMKFPFWFIWTPKKNQFFIHFQALPCFWLMRSIPKLFWSVNNKISIEVSICVKTEATNTSFSIWFDLISVNKQFYKSLSSNGLFQQEKNWIITNEMCISQLDCKVEELLSRFAHLFLQQK